jgi:hypothetical protein
MENLSGITREHCGEPGCGASLQLTPDRNLAFCAQGHCWVLASDPAGMILDEPGIWLMRNRRLDQMAAYATSAPLPAEPWIAARTAWAGAASH